MGWADELGGLTQEILADHNARGSEQKARHASVARFLSETETARKKGFRELHRQIMGQRQARSQQVAGMRQDTAGRLASFQQEETLAHAHWCGLGKALAGRHAASK